MKRRVIGFDINTTRVQQLRDGVDVTQEVSSEELAEVSQLSFTTELEDFRGHGVHHHRAHAHRPVQLSRPALFAWPKPPR
jgi:hypothetical protein